MQPPPPTHPGPQTARLVRRGSSDGSVPWWRRVRSAKGHRHRPGEYAALLSCASQPQTGSFQG
ncbi:hypothetical protein DI272_21805 [Streptomyces sp. Act143]|nr:hypothetical protein DI272_21805 [Streptomyces sp. Act143]